MKNVLFVSLALCAGLLACKQETGSIDSIPNGAERKISIGSNIASGVSVAVKAPILNTEAVTGIQFFQKNATAAVTDFSAADVKKFTADRSAATPDANGSYPIVWSATSGAYPIYATNDDVAYFLATYPAFASGKMAIDGKTDILVSDVYSAGKYTAPITGMGGSDPAMVFNHRLARLEVKCMAVDPTDATKGAGWNVVKNTWGKITKIEFETAPELAIDLAASGATTASGTAAYKALFNPDYATAFASVDVPEFSASPTVSAAGMFAPSTGALKIRITTAKTVTPIVVSVTLGTNQDFEVGKTHTVTLTFNANVQTLDVLKTEITDWATGFVADGDVVMK